MPTSTEDQRKNNRYMPTGPLTKAEQEDRLTFAISTFSNCVGEEAQLQAIMTYCKVKRLQATRILKQARDHLGQMYTDWQAHAAEDAFQFLYQMRNNPIVSAKDRLAAQKELRDTFGYGVPQPVTAPQVSTTINIAVQQAVLADPRALDAALALEAALGSAGPPECAGAQTEHEDGPTLGRGEAALEAVRG